MEIRIKTDRYNPQRYSAPWVAKVDFRESANGVYSWGDWVKNHHNGRAGTLRIITEVGEIIAIGQEDFHNSCNNAPKFYVASLTNGLELVGDKDEVYQYFLDHKNDTPGQTALQAELTLLTKNMNMLCRRPMRWNWLGVKTRFISIFQSTKTPLYIGRQGTRKLH